MAKKKSRQWITLESTESSYRTSTIKNPKNTPQRLEIKKYDPLVKKHTLFREKK